MRWIVPLLLVLAPVQAASADSYGSSGERLSYVLMTGGGTNSMMNGSTDDIRRAEAYRAGNADLLFVRENGAAYVIRDPAILQRAEAIMAPQRELGKRQGALGRQQGELGRQQGALGRQQGELGRQMADARVREVGDLARQQAELGRQQAALGAQQAALGQRQAALGREQARASQLAEPQFRALVNEAIRRGLAQRVD